MTDPTTDSARCHLWLDPTMTAAIDAARGDTPRSRFILEEMAKRLKLKHYTPRSRGRAKKQPDE